MNTYSTNCKYSRTCTNILIIFVILAVAFSGIGRAAAQEPNPHFTVFPEWEWFDGWDWPDGATVTITVEGKPECATTKESWGNFFNGSFGEGCDVAVEDIVTFIDGTTTRTHTVRKLAVTEVDKDANIVRGTADAGAEVYVWPHATGEQQLATMNIDGNWEVNFSGIYDLAPGTDGRSQINDEMGNATAVDWHIPNPRMVIFPEWEWFDGNDWPDGATVTITVEGKPECATTKESWGNFFNGSFGEGCDVVIGDLVTFTDGVTIRAHTVRNLGVTGVDADQDTVTGTADEGAEVYVWPHATGQQQLAIAGAGGSWEADFSGIFNLVPGEAGRSEIRDAAGNSTAVDWSAPWTPSTFTVNTTDNNDDGTCDETHCSLQEAINVANARAAADTIAFNIPGDPPFTIQPQPGYPDLWDTVMIDGTTQPGFDGAPLIELNGTYTGFDANGLVITASDSIVKGLAINRFAGNGIVVFGSGNTIQDNYIGTDLTGTTTIGPAGTPVGEPTITVMEACPTYPVGTDFNGFVSESEDPLAPWSGTAVHFKGTEECGSPEMVGAASLIYRYRLEFAEVTPLESIAVSGAAFNGPDSILRVLDENMNLLGTANTFGGNSFQTPFVKLEGVAGTIFYVDEFDTSNTWRFRQNLVINGPLPIGNHANGVLLAGGATNNRVIDNLISGNMSNGVAIFNPGTTGNTVQENFIGTDVAGTQSLGNAAPGVGIGDQASDNQIVGNLISGNRSDGVSLFNPGTTGNTVRGNYIGTDATGTTSLTNTGAGVWIGNGASNTLIGGSDEGAGNLISGNSSDGISLNDTETTGIVIQGNFIGVDFTGMAFLPNLANGIVIGNGPHDNLIGGTESGARNLISGNVGNGVGIFDPGTTGNTVQGNYIGTDVTGTTMTGPAGPAVGEYTVTTMPETCPTYPVGTDFDGFISESDDSLSPWSGTSVHFLGTEEGCGSQEMIGAASLIYRYKLEFTEETELRSILVSGAAFNGPDNILRVLDENMEVLGTATSFGGNAFQTPFVALQDVVGKVFYVDEFDTSSSWRFRQSIVINGPLPLGNYGNGVSIGSAPDNTIEQNLISGNMASGIGLYGGSTTGNVIHGNLIGTNAEGTTALPNADGLWLGESASNNVIGGLTAEARNVISGNNIFGVSINNPGTIDNVLQGNYIGTDIHGTASIPNAFGGVIVTLGASQNRLGGTDPGAGNVISGNKGDGITIVDLGTSGNIVQGNFIGTDVTGTAALSNSVRGIFVAGGATDNLIGGTESNAGNLISGNGAAGIRITDFGTTGNQVQGNRIGTDITGIDPLGNGHVGIRISDGAANNRIGGTEPGAGNRIAFNADSGIATNLEAGSGNALLSNSLFSNGNLGIDLGEDGVTLNDPLDQDSGPNDLQNFPVITTVTRIGSSVKIQGLLFSGPRMTFRVEFFSNDACDPSVSGEGQAFLGFASVKTNPAGLAHFEVTLPVALPPDAFVTATATNPVGNTSEFSKCFSSTPGWNLVNDNGFGDPSTIGITALEVFENRPYAGASSWNTGGQIWRLGNDGLWAQVIGDGFGSGAANAAVIDLVIFQGQLYAGTGWSGNPGQVWRSVNGSAWQPVTSDGFGNTENIAVTNFVVFKNRLYAGTGSASGSAQIWRSSTGGSGTWTQVAPDDASVTGNVTGFFVYKNVLYAAVEPAEAAGAPMQVWRSTNGSDWTTVTADGFGDENNVSTGGFAQFGGYLYLGTRNEATSAQLWRTMDGLHWQMVVGDGFGDLNNMKIESLIVFNDLLYAATHNLSMGMQVWRSGDGMNWEQVAANGFGDNNNFSTLWNSATVKYQGQLLMGTWNDAEGGELWMFTP